MVLPQSIFLLVIILYKANAQENLNHPWSVEFLPNPITVYVHTLESLSVVISGLNNDQYDTENINDIVKIVSNDNNVARVHNQLQLQEVVKDGGVWQGSFTFSGVLIGSTRFHLEVTTRAIFVHRSNNFASVSMIRPRNVWDLIYSVTIFVVTTLIYISVGAAIDLKLMYTILKSPKAPIIGILCQFIMMPLTAYGLGLWLFSDDVYMFLGIFFLGIAPGGGPSNVWTMVLGGNLNLSILLTTSSKKIEYLSHFIHIISKNIFLAIILAFGTIPLYAYTLGTNLFEQLNEDFVIPYIRMMLVAFAFIFPLLVGIFLQRWPKVSQFLIKWMKPVAGVLVLLVVALGVVVNLHVFPFFSWKTVMATMGFPILGFIFGYLVGIICRLNHADSLAVSIETGTQHYATAIFLIQFSLEQPAQDIAVVSAIKS